MKLIAKISIQLHSSHFYSDILIGLLNPGYYTTFWLADISETKTAFSFKAKIDKC